MTSSRSAIFLAALACLTTSYGVAGAQKPKQSSASDAHQVLALTFANNGRTVAATVGQQIEITLGMVGPRQYGEPLVSSAAIRLESVALQWPVNPGGATLIYIFDAAEAGEAQVTVPVINAMTPEMEESSKQLTFTATIRVGPAHGKLAGSAPHVPYAFRTPDQANTAPSTKQGAWTNLVNNAQQTFTPALAKLTGIEVELAAADPGASDGEVTMTLLNPEGQVLTSVSKTVAVADCGHVRFAIPNGGVPVSPGQTYRISLSNSGVFGWKYVVGGYANGAAFFNGKPLMRDRRGTFLFRTFGRG